jgi:hypothetical protein
MKNLPAIVLSGVLALIFLGSSRSAHATVTYTFGGDIVSGMLPYVGVDETWSMTVRIDETSPSISGSKTRYPLFGDVFLSFSGGLSGAFASGSFYVEDNDSFGMDTLSMDLTSPSPSLSPLDFSHIRPEFSSISYQGNELRIWDPTQMTLSSEALPLFLDRSDWLTAGSVLSWESRFIPGDGVFHPRIFARINHMSATRDRGIPTVPDMDNTFVLLGLVCCGLISFHRLAPRRFGSN